MLFSSLNLGQFLGDLSLKLGIVFDTFFNLKVHKNTLLLEFLQQWLSLFSIFLHPHFNDLLLVVIAHLQFVYVTTTVACTLFRKKWVH
jgi:hypothetical protein